VEKGGESQKLIERVEVRTLKVSFLSFFLGVFWCRHFSLVKNPLSVKRRRRRRTCCFSALSWFFVLLQWSFMTKRMTMREILHCHFFVVTTPFNAKRTMTTMMCYFNATSLFFVLLQRNFVVKKTLTQNFPHHHFFFFCCNATHSYYLHSVLVLCFCLSPFLGFCCCTTVLVLFFSCY